MTGCNQIDTLLVLAFDNKITLRIDLFIFCIDKNLKIRHIVVFRDNVYVVFPSEGSPESLSLSLCYDEQETNEKHSP